jgi:hypothetical protein
MKGLKELLANFMALPSSKKITASTPAGDATQVP